MTTRSDIIKALHENAKWQTHVTFNAAFTDEERERELRRLRKEQRGLEKTLTSTARVGAILERYNP
jgi:hypothetical protein